MKQILALPRQPNHKTQEYHLTPFAGFYQNALFPALFSASPAISLRQEIFVFAERNKFLAAKRSRKFRFPYKFVQKKENSRQKPRSPPLFGRKNVRISKNKMSAQTAFPLTVPDCLCGQAALRPVRKKASRPAWRQNARIPTRENRVFAAAPCPSPKYAIFGSPEVTF